MKSKRSLRTGRLLASNCLRGGSIRRAALCTAAAFALHAQSPGSITTHSIPSAGLSAIDAQQNVYTAIGGFAGFTTCLPMAIVKAESSGRQIFSINGPGTCGVETVFTDLTIDSAGSVYAVGTVDIYPPGAVKAFAAKVSADGSKFT